MNPINAAILVASGTAVAPLPGLLWSAPSTWGGTVPVDGADVLIPYGTAIVLDTTTARLNSLRIAGDLYISNRRDSQLFVNRMSGAGGGRLLSGTASSPNQFKHTRTMIGPKRTINNSAQTIIEGFTHIGNTPTGNNGTTNDDNGIDRGFLVEDGFQYLIFAATPSVIKTTISGNHAAGANQLTLSTPVNWKAGDEIVVYPTDFYDPTKRAERFTIAADTNNSTVVQLYGTLGYARYGKLQYPDDNKTIREVTPGAFTTGVSGMRATALVPNVLDQRAKVQLLTRSHVVQGDNDAAWTSGEFGAHEMFMGLSTKVVIKGQRYSRSGQAGRQGRYPLHFHGNAYNADGTAKTNPLTGLSNGYFAAGQAVIENCVVTDSSQRGMVAHACCGVLFKNNTIHKVKGHAYLQEDGAELGLTYDGCHAVTMDPPSAGKALKINDNDPVGFWIVNVDINIISTTGLKNGTADSAGHGVAVINSKDRAGFPGGCFGISSQVPISPFYTPPTNWQGIESHSNATYGKKAQLGLTDEQGNSELSRGHATDTHRAIGNDVEEPFVGNVLWKNNAGNYLNERFHPVYDGWIVADGADHDFFGNANFGEIKNTLFVNKSNNSNLAQASVQRIGVTSYHGSLVPRDCSVFGYEMVGVPSIGTSGRFSNKLRANASFVSYLDTYLFPLHAWTVSMPNIRSSAAMNFYIGPEPSLETGTAPWSAWTGGVAGWNRGNNVLAVFDPYGQMFGVGIGVTSLQDYPYFTAGAGTTLPILASDATYIGVVGTTKTVFGISNNFDATSILDAAGSIAFGWAATWKRADPVTLADLPVVGYDRIGGTSAAAGDYDVQTVLPDGGWTRIYNRTDTTQTYSKFKMDLTVVSQGDGKFCGLGLPWANTKSFSGAPLVGTKALMLAATTTTAWRDTTTQIVWIKLYSAGGIYADVTSANGTFFHGYGLYTTTFVFA